MGTADIAGIVERIAADMATIEDRGPVADYIPGLAMVDPAQFGIAVVTPDGALHLGGDA